MKHRANTDGPAKRGSAVLALLLGVMSLLADDAKLAALLQQADAADVKRETQTALKILTEADTLSPNNPEVLYRLAKQRSNLIFGAKNPAEQKELAAQCLALAQRAVAANTNHAKAHLSVAICYAKNFPYCDNQTKVNYSRLLKQEAERAIALDPKLDLAYHMLGRWHREVAGMNFVLKAIAKMAYGGLPQGSHEAAAANFKKAAELDPLRVLHHFHLGKTLLTLDQKKAAIAEFQLCLTLPPKDMDDTEAQAFARERLQSLGVKVEGK